MPDRTDVGEQGSTHVRRCGLHSTGYCNGSCGCPCHAVPASRPVETGSDDRPGGA